ncbi:MAG: hypothetical protein ACLRZL_14135 [Alistipes communis]
MKGHIREYDRHLILAQYNSPCDKEAIEAYDSMDYIEYNISQIARCFGLDDTNLSKQLRTHYPRVIKRHEKVRKRLGLSDNLPHGTRQFCKEAVCRGRKAATRGSLHHVQRSRSEQRYIRLEQHLLFYHKELMGKRIEIREKAVEQQRKGKITSCGSLHAPKVARVEKYAEALRFYRTIPYAARIAAQTNVSRGGFYEHLQTRHKGPVCRRKGIPYAEGIPIGCRK